MDSTLPTHNPHAAPRFRTIGLAEDKLAQDPIEALQLARLANTVLSKSLADIDALAEDNPHLVWEWIQAFAVKKREADSAAQLWSSAIACLATSGTRQVRRTAAE
jgi:hypothetical protein